MHGKFHIRKFMLFKEKIYKKNHLNLHKKSHSYLIVFFILCTSTAAAEKTIPGPGKNTGAVPEVKFCHSEIKFSMAELFRQFLQ